MFGPHYKDEKGKTAEAPCKVSIGNLCKDCKATIEKGGIFFIECKDGESGDNPHRTGRVIAVKESAVMGVFTNYGKVNYMEQSIFEKFFGHFTYTNT